MPVEVSEAALDDHVTKSAPYNNGNGTVGSDDITWDFAIQPSLGWAQSHKQLLQNLSYAETGAGLAAGAVSGGCALIPIPDPLSKGCAAVFGVAAAGDGVLALFFQWLATDPVDSHYKSIATPLAGHIPRIRQLDGLSRAQTAAVNAFVRAEARTVSLAAAAATAVNRYSGAALADNTRWKQKQDAAARAYAGQLASSLTTELADAKLAERAVADTVLGSYTVSAAQIQGLQESIASHGIPHPRANHRPLARTISRSGRSSPSRFGSRRALSGLA
jgi:hypothetical protein